MWTHLQKHIPNWNNNKGIYRTKEDKVLTT